MTATDTFFDLIKARRSLYALAAESPIPNSKIEEIVKLAVTWTPSTFNVQSARAVILFGDNHTKLWESVGKHFDQIPMPEAAKGFMAARVAGWKAAYGTVMFFEDQAPLEALGTKNAMVQAQLPEFSDQSTGMHHFVVWTALEAEGLGANLQHLNTHPGIAADMRSFFDLPETWMPKGQLVFGKSTEAPKEKTFEPIEKRVFVKA